MPAIFTPKTLTFLRALARNNDREWFKAHKAEFVTHVQTPLHALIERLAGDFQSFAPDLACSPRESTFRQYRDTRFSEDKSPLKTHVSAVFPSRLLAKGEGAGLYVQIDPKEVWIGGGLYHPPSPVLQLVRAHIAANLQHLRAIVESPAFKRRVGAVSGETLTRVPRGFDATHPAAAYLKHKDLLVMKTFPGRFGADPAFYATLVGLFRDMAPFVRFLNEPLITRAKKAAFLSSQSGVLGLEC
jgi:uncharacterized protein (TIGR02453 family)